MYPAIHLFDFPISTYSLMSLVGGAAVILYIYLTNRGGRAGRLPGSEIVNILALSLVAIIVGGKLLGFITMIPPVIQHADATVPFIDVVMALFSTFVFYGGLLGALFAVYIYCRRYKISLRLVFGFITPAIPLFHFIARIGCFLAGCCWGVEVSWGLECNAPLVGLPHGVPLMPVQLFESAFNLLLFIALAILSRRLTQKWRVLPIYFLAYGAGRFVLEFFRGDALRGHFWIFSTSQWISLLLIAAGVVLLVKYRGDSKASAEKPKYSHQT